MDQRWPSSVPPLEAWHPSLRRLFDYWRSIHPAEGLPGRQHFDPIRIPDVLPIIALVDVHREPAQGGPAQPRFRYRLIGTRAVWIWRHDWTGKWLDEVYPNFADSGYRAVALTISERGKWWYARGPSQLANNPDFLSVELLVLPLARDGRTVDMLLTGNVYYGRDGRPAL